MKALKFTYEELKILSGIVYIYIDQQRSNDERIKAIEKKLDIALEEARRNHELTYGR